jgi:dienelactone hydrolase
VIVRGNRFVAVGVASMLAVLVTTGCAAQPRPAPAQPAADTRSAADARAIAAAAGQTAARPRAVQVAGVAGEYQVSWLRLTFREPASGGPRTLATEIRYPAGGGPFPLLMFAPGFLQCGAPYGDLLRTWASAGYVVATVDFPRTDCRVGAGADEADLVNQPADMSYAIGRLLALSAGHDDPLTGTLDAHEIAAAGQSDGGDTVAALAANSCCADRRLAAVAVLSGAEWPPMPGRYFAGRTPPMLFTQGSADTVNPPWTSLRMYTSDRSRARYYLDLPGADHTEPYWGNNPVERLVGRETLAFFDHYVLSRPDGMPPAPGLVSAGRLP